MSVDAVDLPMTVKRPNLRQTPKKHGQPLPVHRDLGDHEVPRMVDAQATDLFLAGNSGTVLPAFDRQPSRKKRRRGNGSAFNARPLRKMYHPLINEDTMRSVCAVGE